MIPAFHNSGTAIQTGDKSENVDIVERLVQEFDFVNSTTCGTVS